MIYNEICIMTPLHVVLGHLGLSSHHVASNISSDADDQISREIRMSGKAACGLQ